MTEHPLQGLTYADVKAELWKRGDLSFKLDSLQLRIRKTIRDSTARKIGILSARQIGKSYFSGCYALEFLIKNPGTIARIVAPTLKQCNDIVQDNLAPIMRDSPPGFIERQKSEYRWSLSNGSSLRLGALERAHVDGNRGGNASLVIYEECGFVNAEDFDYGVNSVLGPQLLRSAGLEIYVSSPSENPDHPLHTRILPECEATGTAFRYTVYDSPSITPEMIEEAARRCGGYESDAFKREYLAQIIRPSTLVVIPAFDPKHHVAIYNLPSRFHMHVTIDMGGVRDRTVALMHTYDFENNQFLFWDERHWPPNTATSTIVRELKEWEQGWNILSRHADAHGQNLIDLVAQGYDVSLPPKSDWLASVQTMASKFATGRILIHPRCEFLIRSCRGGLFNKNRTDYERLPELGHCDALAAMSYAIRTQDTSSPWGFQALDREFVFFTKEPEAPEMEVARIVNPVQFGGSIPRGFGSFRR